MHSIAHVTHTVSVTAWLILHYCWCITHTTLLLLRDSYTASLFLCDSYCISYCVTHTALLLMQNSYYISYCVTHMALLLMRDSSWINVTAWLIYSIALPMWLILHHCYCVTQIVLMLLRDSYCITVTCDSSCFTVSAWLIYSIALPMWLILHHLLCDSYCINVTTWFKLHHCYLRLTLLYCYCVTHTASVTAWLILRNCYCVTHTSIMLLCDPYFNNVTVWPILQ